jgi:hypothetical protein
MFEFIEYYKLGEELEKELAAKFNIDLSTLEYLGGGSCGEVWKIDEKSVLKMTRSRREEKTVLKLIETGLTLELGHTTILPQDTFRFLHWFAYRRELLFPLKDIDPFYPGMREYHKIIQDLVEVNIAAHIMGRDFIARKANEQELADKFLQEMSRLGFLQKTELVAIILLIYQAAIGKIFLWDLSEYNAGFRIDENGKPAVDAGLVFFDPMAII